MGYLMVVIALVLCAAQGCSDGGASAATDSRPESDSAARDTAVTPARDGMAPVDAGPPALDVVPPGQPYPEDGFCRTWLACQPGEVCDLSLGRCERRAALPANKVEIYGFKPLAAAAGDRLVIDGQSFYDDVFDAIGVRVRVGSTELVPVATDENRLVVAVTEGLSGPVTVVDDQGQAAAQAPAPLSASSPGIVPCDGSTPLAAGVDGPELHFAGRHGAGYVDDPDQELRVYYPAACGSVRRSPVAGTHPLVVILQGDGAGYMHYDYLGQYLASWGFLAALPAKPQEDELEVPSLVKAIKALIGADLGLAVSPVLAGVATRQGQLALIGHSKGSARLQGIVADAELAAVTVASVFLGPVDDGKVVPGAFLAFSATGDLQSPSSYADNAYARQPPPKWKVAIKGGNHSMFTDHKVWVGMLLDQPPGIERTQQLRIVTSFVMPLLQRAFQLPERFADQLDQPSPTPLYDVQHTTL